MQLSPPKLEPLPSWKGVPQEGLDPFGVRVITATYEFPDTDSVPPMAHAVLVEHEMDCILVMGVGMLSCVHAPPAFVVCSTMGAGDDPLLSPKAKHDCALGQEMPVRFDVPAIRVGADQTDPVIEVNAPPSAMLPTAKQELEPEQEIPVVANPSC